MTEIYPWQHDIWSRLTASSSQNRIAHALLFTGANGLGKLQLATLFKSSLLCSENKPGEIACTQCRFCKMQNHPDYYQVTQEEDERTGKMSKVIKVDQIRELIKFTLLHSHYGQAKVIIIQPADAMNKNAANSLLKILEEPPKNTYFILVSSNPSVLPAAIKSRCQQIKFDIPTTLVAEKWMLQQTIEKSNITTYLNLAFGAPLLAKQLSEIAYIDSHDLLTSNLLAIINNSEDPVDIANSWLKLDVNLPLKILYTWFSDLILLKSAQNYTNITNSNSEEILKLISTQVSFTGLYLILDKISMASQQVQFNIAILGIYEDILNLWQRLTRNITIPIGSN